MTPVGLAGFVVGVFALRMVGGFCLAGVLERHERLARLLALLPLAIVAAVVATQTFTIRQDLTVDARVVGVSVAGLASWRGVPLGAVVVLAAVSTALVRQAGWG